MLPYSPQVTRWEVEGRELKSFVQRSEELSGIGETSPAMA